MPQTSKKHYFSGIFRLAFSHLFLLSGLPFGNEDLYGHLHLSYISGDSKNTNMVLTLSTDVSFGLVLVTGIYRTPYMLGQCSTTEPHPSLRWICSEGTVPEALSCKKRNNCTPWVGQVMAPSPSTGESPGGRPVSTSLWDITP